MDKIIFDTFDIVKTTFGNKRLVAKKGNVQLSPGFTDCYRSEIERNIKTADIRERFSSDCNELCITDTRFITFFNPIIEQIKQHIADVLENVSDVRTIYLVGGFGGCPYIHSILAKEFNDKTFITPREREHATAKGAVIMRKKPELLKARRAEATYGVEVRIPFIQDVHDEEYKVKGRENMCSDIFATYVERGEIINPKFIYQMSFTPERDNQDFMRVQIYSSSENDVWYISGKRPTSTDSNNTETWCDVHKIGELVIPLTDVTDSNRTVNVMFDFSTAEIKVTGEQQSTGTKVKIVLDFF